MTENGNVKRFHQFVKTDRGPFNTAVIDLLKEQVYQVENTIIDALEQHRYDEITEFLESAKEEDLIIEIDGRDWIPPCGEVQEPIEQDIKEKVFDIELHVEAGVNLEEVLEKLDTHNVFKIVFYGRELPQIPIEAPIEKREKNFTKCSERICMNGDLEPINESTYTFNRQNNSCWGGKFAVTGDGKVRPCIYSSIVIGDILGEDVAEILDKLQTYWRITKDKVEKCKECELRYVCFDCREIPYRNSGDLYSANPLCKYNHINGAWGE